MPVEVAFDEALKHMRGAVMLVGRVLELVDLNMDCLGLMHPCASQALSLDSKPVLNRVSRNALDGGLRAGEYSARPRRAAGSPPCGAACNSMWGGISNRQARTAVYSLESC